MRYEIEEYAVQVCGQAKSDYLFLQTPPPSMAQRALGTALLSRTWLIDSRADHIRDVRGDPRCPAVRE